MKALKFLKRIKQTDTPYNFREWEINEAIEELEKAMKPKTCEGCKHKPNDGECYYEPCGTCARFFYDHYSPKDNA
jgi:hypothetical protein